LPILWHSRFLFLPLKHYRIVGLFVLLAEENNIEIWYVYIAVGAIVFLSMFHATVKH
jgi:hypothetical protein